MCLAASVLVRALCCATPQAVKGTSVAAFSREEQAQGWLCQGSTLRQGHASVGKNSGQAELCGVGCLWYSNVLQQGRLLACQPSSGDVHILSGFLYVHLRTFTRKSNHTPSRTVLGGTITAINKDFCFHAKPTGFTVSSSSDLPFVSNCLLGPFCSWPVLAFVYILLILTRELY